MGIGLSDGTNYADMGEWVAHTSSGVPLEGSTEPAGALKSSGGSETPDKGQKVNWEGYNQPFGSIKGTAPEDTPVLFKTKAGNITEGDIQRGMDIAGSFGTGTMAGVKSLGMKARYSNLGEAQVMEMNGANAEDIYRKTGMFRGAEGRWRYEIDDSKAKLNEKWADNPTPEEAKLGFKKRKLPEVIDHPELYEAYPHLKNLDITFGLRYGRGAEYNSLGIYVGSEKYKDLGTLMHEVQHAIQSYEGFAKGGAPGKAGKDYNLRLDPLARDKIEDPLRMLVSYKERFGSLPPHMQQEADRLVALAKKYQEYAEAGNIKAFENYQALAGEVESRNVDTRLLLNAEERRRMPPSWTEDTPRSAQIISDKPVLATPYTK